MPFAILQEKLKSVPLLKALVPLIAGIIAGSCLNVPFYVWAAAAIVSGIMALTGVGKVISDIYICFAVLFFGAAAARFHAPKEVVPKGERVWLEVQITENPVYRGGRSAQTSAVAGRWRTEQGQWNSSGEKFLVSFDTSYRFSAGDRLVFRGYVNPVSDTAGSYARLMRARGYTGRTYVSQYSRAAVSPASGRSLPLIFKDMQRTATERLRRLGMGEREFAVAAAMTTGDRSGITPGLRSSYARTGAIHLLSVSGIHVAMVFMLVNTLLYFLPVFRYGHIVKNLLAVLLIWVYAAMTGLSPPVVRSAFMFTGAQAALALSSRRSAANIICGTAFIMLAVDPGMLFDISFQLSFISVAAITAWFRSLYTLLQSRWKLLNAVWSSLIVALVASTATMPLVSHTFGIFSPAGIALSPVVVLSAYFVLLFSLVWTVIPAPFLEPLFRWLAGGPAWLQNKIIELSGEVPGMAVEYTLPLGWTVLVYAAMIIFTAWLASRPHIKEPFVLPR